MNHLTAMLTAAIVAAALLTLGERAEAGGIPIVINWGDDFIAEQQLPDDFKEHAAGATHIGYHCQHFGFFGLSLWTWDGHWCVFDHEYHREISNELAALALGIEGDDPGKPFFYRVPLGIFVALVVVAGWTAFDIIKRKMFSGRNTVGRTRDPDLEAIDEEISQKQAAIEQHVMQLIEEGNAVEAHTLYANTCNTFGEWELPTKTLWALIVALDRQKQHAKVLPLMTEYVERCPDAPARVRLRLAQLLLTVASRPIKALQILDTIDIATLDEQKQRIVSQLRAKAEQLSANEDGDLRLADE